MILVLTEGENNLSFTPTQYGCAFYYKSSVPEIWPFNSRRQLLIIIFKEQKQCLVLHRELRVKTFPSIFKNVFSEYSWKLCVCVYMHQSTKNCSLCTHVGLLVWCKENTVLPIWIITKTYPSFNNTIEFSYLIVGLMRLPMQICGLFKMIQLLYERHHPFTELFSWTFLAMFIKVCAPHLPCSLNWRVWVWQKAQADLEWSLGIPSCLFHVDLPVQLSGTCVLSLIEIKSCEPG